MKQFSLLLFFILPLFDVANHFNEDPAGIIKGKVLTSDDKSAANVSVRLKGKNTGVSTMTHKCLRS